jgi:6-phosphogluconate dehydrogenase
MGKDECRIGIIGLGVMGRNLLLNIADRGFSAAGYDRDPWKVEKLRKVNQPGLRGEDTLEDFVQALERPRAALMLVPAGAPVDSVIDDIKPHLEEGDILIDGGNSHFTDTDRRAEALRKEGLHFIGMGVSGGAYGARHGPSMMPGGSRDGYARVEDVLRAATAKVGRDPCVAFLGPGSAGHYVKMIHNGIEYAVMELLAECYDFMRRGFGMTNDEMGTAFAQWNESEIGSYLVEITGKVLVQKDDRSKDFLIDRILDEAEQKGTGMWSSQNAMDLGVPVPTIDAAVVMRNLSADRKTRHKASDLLPGTVQIVGDELAGDKEREKKTLHEALHMSMILAYTQGFAQLHSASPKYDYGLKLEDVARIWRGGCIIRADLLEEIRTAFRERPGISNLLLSSVFAARLSDGQTALRRVVRSMTKLGIPAPGFSTALAYYDAYRSPRLPANLIQAQRDFFGSHTYRRVDADGTFHTEWSWKE